MSLEQALAANTAATTACTAAIKELLAAWNATRAQSSTRSVVTPAEMAPAVEQTLKLAQPTEAPTEAVTEAPTAVPTTPPTEAVTEAPTEAVTEAPVVLAAVTKAYLEAAVRKYAPTHRSLVVSTFADFGVKRANELSEDQYGPYIAALLKKVGA